MDNLKRIRKLPYLIAFAVVIGIVIFLLRGPHISNALKKIILPKLEAATGRSIIAKKIYINIFPLFIEARGLKVFDVNGERILFANRAKAYIELSGLLNKNIVIRRLVIKEPEIAASKEQIDEIIENVKAYAAKKRDTSLSVIVMAVEVKQGSADLTDQKTKSLYGISGLNGEIILGKTQRIKVSAEKIKVKKQGWPEITVDADINLTLKGETIQINKVIIGSSGSKITGSGEYHKDRGSFKTDSDLLIKTIKQIFKLDQSGEGEISIKGDITYVDKEISVDLKIAGNFYLQTLMELLKVKKRLEGLLNVKGEIKGRLNDIKGMGTATLHKGNLFNVDIDFLKCNVSYSNGKMRFLDGDGRLYNGSAKVSASIKLPKVNFFTLDIDFTNIDSSPLFKLIRWDPEIQNGKVKGSLSSSGAQFNPEGWFEYKNKREGKDVRGRVRDIAGRYTMQDKILSLTDLRLSTGRSELNVNGLVDIDEKRLNLDAILETIDITDISSPYYKRLKGTGEFRGKIKGSFDDPEISGKMKIYNPIIEDYPASILDADITYKKEILNIMELTLEAEDELHKLNGSIYFKNAKELFDLSEPEFRLNATLKNADLERFAKIFYLDFTGTGRLHSDMKIGGTYDNPEVSADAVIEKAVIYRVPFDSASLEFRYADKKLNFAEMKIKRGESLFNAEAAIDAGGNFSYKAASDNLMLNDLIQKEIQGDIVFSVKTEGHGRFDNPSITMDARMTSRTREGRSVESGIITASIKDRDFSLRANMINEKLNITVKARLEKEIPWEAEVEIQPGRYDLLIKPFLKEVPEDLRLSLNGVVSLHGDKSHISGFSVIKHVALSMYGYTFSNKEEIRLSLNDRELVLNKISLMSGNTSLSINGSLVIGKRYNLALEGSSTISPLKSLSSKIGLLKGDAEFVLSVSGNWDTPRINGELNISNGSFGLKDYYHRISSLNGYIYMDNDRIVLKKLSGKVGGGDIEISGIIYLKKFSFKRFYIDAKLDNIRTSVSDDFSISFGGNILYKGTPASQMASGDIEINQALYRERIEWKSWLLKAKKTRKYKAEISDFEKTELNIRVTGKDNILIDNNVARATVSADMVLRGTVYRPILFGRLESREGTLYFRNNEFRILHASAVFTNPHRIYPVVEIASETIVKSYKIKMNLEGQIDHFNLTLSSDPPLKEMDILALLTVGQTGDELKGKGLQGGIGASEATSFVTGKLQDVVEERLRTITGLDRLQIDPYVSKTTGSVEPRVTVSKRLLGEKMFVTYTTTLGSTEEQIIKLEYFLSKNISVVGVRDERGIVGGDIRFRFEFK